MPQTLFGGTTSPYAGVLGSGGIDALLKDMNLAIINVAKKEVPAWDAFGETTLQWTAGRRATFPVRHQENGSFAGVPEQGRLPEPGATKHKEGEIWAKFIYSQMSITGQAVKFSRTSAQAQASALKTELESLRDGLKFNMQRMIWMDGVALLGKASVVAVAGAVATITLDTTVADAETNTSKMRAGQLVVWGTTAQLANTGAPNVPDGAGYVSEVSGDAEVKVTKTYGNDPAPLDYLTPGTYSSAAGAYACSYNNEFAGLKLFGSVTATCQGLTVADSPWWKPLQIQVNGGLGNLDIKQEYLMRMVSAYKRYTGTTPDMIWGHPGMAVEVFKMLYPDQRFAPLELMAGNKKLTFTYEDKQIPFHWDDMGFRNELTFIKNSDLKFSWCEPLGWVLDEFTGRILRERQGYDEGIATMGGYGQMLTLNRRTIGRLQDLNCTVDFVG
jgi:hypothetical protein